MDNENREKRDHTPVMREFTNKQIINIILATDLRDLLRRGVDDLAHPFVPSPLQQLPAQSGFPPPLLAAEHRLDVVCLRKLARTRLRVEEMLPPPLRLRPALRAAHVALHDARRLVPPPIALAPRRRLRRLALGGESTRLLARRTLLGEPPPRLLERLRPRVVGLGLPWRARLLRLHAARERGAARDAALAVVRRLGGRHARLAESAEPRREV